MSASTAHEIGIVHYPSAPTRPVSARIEDMSMSLAVYDRVGASKKSVP